MICPLPWFHLYVDEQGYFFPCCFCDKSVGALENEKGEPIHASSPTYLEEFKNSPTLKKMRHEMVAGKMSKYCNGCYKTEAAGIKSFRQRSLERMPIDSSQELSTQPPLQLTSVDIRLGNQCDLACRMCSPTSSKNLYKPFMEFHQHQEPSLLTIDWFDRDSFWEQLLEYSNQIVFLYLAGGEPLRSKLLPELLQKLVEKKRAPHIWLSINTNLNHIPPYAQTLWKEFKGIDLTLSIDGVGKVNDYIRYPSKWENIRNNILEIDQYPERYNVKDCTIHSVVQIYNIFNIGEIIDFCSSFKSIAKDPLFDFVIGDPALDIQVLSKRLKKDVSLQLEKLIERASAENLKHQLQEILRHLNEKDQSHYIERFQKMTAIFDSHFKQNLKDYIPELLDIHDL